MQKREMEKKQREMEEQQAKKDAEWKAKHQEDTNRKIEEIRR